MKPLFHLLALMLFIGCSSLVACGQSTTAIAFAKNPRTAKFAPEFISSDHYKYQTTQRVFNDLLKGWSDNQMQTPQLVMNKGRQFIAWMDPTERTIGVEERAYDVCTQFGKDSLHALAALLAHEIIHYYYYDQSEWAQQFINNNQKGDSGNPTQRQQVSLDFEAQADYLGGILAFSAGYNTYDVFSGFLKKAYTQYGLPEEIQGYPSLTERFDLNVSTADSLRQLHAVYQTANLLTMVGEHETAADYYKHILKTYQSFEIYNNAGVNATLAALDLMDPKDLPFVLPLELDANSRLDELVTRLPEDVEFRKQKLLADAAQWFQKTQQMAEQEALGTLNLSIVYLLQGKMEDAQSWSNKALKIAQENQQNKTVADIQILQGILAAQSGNKDLAEEQFKAALNNNPPLAQINLDLLKGKNKAAASKTAPIKGVERIEGLFLDDFLIAPDINVTAQLAPGVYCGKNTFPQSTVLMHYAEEGASYAVFHQTGPTYTGESNWKVGLGASIEEVISNYQDPDKILQLRTGTCLLYEHLNILFIFNQNSSLEKWILFRKNIDPE
jgi:tetratricopeptide (TPR) repeat protein